MHRVFKIQETYNVQCLYKCMKKTARKRKKKITKKLPTSLFKHKESSKFAFIISKRMGEGGLKNTRNFRSQ